MTASSRMKWSCLAFLTALIACSELSAPLPYQLQPPDRSLDPAAIRIGDVYYGCDRWALPQPAEKNVVVDVFFGRRSAQDPADRPLDEQLDVIRAVGGTPLFSFNFPAVRAWVPTREIPTLYDRWPGMSVHTVPDERRYDWQATVIYDQPISEADVQQVSALGGRILEQLGATNMLAIELPNASFPALRSSANVTFVEAAGLGCVAVQSAG